jgi:DNA repair exonuclease SbcCD ATPase subunit
MTDGNTYAINKHLDEREDYDALQEVTAELEQAEARIEELEAENKTLRSMVADVIADTGDDPKIMAVSRAEWAARALAAEAELEQAWAENEKCYDAWLDAQAEIIELEAKLAKALAELERLGFDFQSILGRELKG